MPDPYSNPRYSQAFSSTYNGMNVYGLQVIPLPPDPVAYSKGPPAGAYPLTLTTGFITSTYNVSSSGSSYVSNCGLLKDENDHFWYVQVYRSSGAPAPWIYVDEWDDINSVRVYHEITLPVEFSSVFHLGFFMEHMCCFMRKTSSTTFDLVFFGRDNSEVDLDSKNYIQLYHWTIGSPTMTFVGEYSYYWSETKPGSLGSTIRGLALNGNKVIIAIAFSGAGGYKVNVVEFDLDSGAGSSYEFFNSSSTLYLSSYDWKFVPAGKKVYFAMVYTLSGVTKKHCTGWLGGEFDMSLSAEVWKRGIVYENGAATTYGDRIQLITGAAARAYGADIAMSGYGVDVDTGEAYTRIEYGWDRNDDDDCSHCFMVPAGWPCSYELRGAVRAYVSLSDFTQYARWEYEVLYGEAIPWPTGRYSDPGYWTTSVEMKYPGRFGPLSMQAIAGLPETEKYYLLNWATLDDYAQGKIGPQGYGGLHGVAGEGQRNDNLPIQIGYEQSPYFWSTIFIDHNGDDYSLIKNVGGTSNNPITGFVGIWPVYHKEGRWLIYKPLQESPLLPRWQVV